MLFKRGLNYTIIFDGFMLYDTIVTYPNGGYVRYSENSLMESNFMVLPSHRFSFSALDTVFNIGMDFYGSSVSKALSRYKGEPWYGEFMGVVSTFQRQDGANENPFEEYLLLENGEISKSFIEIVAKDTRYSADRRSYSLGHYSNMRAVFRRETTWTSETSALQALVDSATCRDKLLRDLQRHGIFLGCNWVECSSIVDRLQYKTNQKTVNYWGSRAGAVIKHKFTKIIESIPMPLRKEILSEVFNANHLNKVVDRFGIGAIS